MSSEETNRVSNMFTSHDFVLQRHHAPMSDTHGSDSHNIILDTALPRYEIEEGENWLRLLQKEGRSILDDTQSTQELLDESQSSTVYPSIVALSNVGIVEAPSLDCFICIDLDGATVAVKDMRTPGIAENHSSDTDLSQRSSPLGLHSQLGIYRKQTGDWEVLRRRRLRILSPGDRICTFIQNGKPGGLCLEYQCVKRPQEVKNDSLSQGLLTQPQDDNDTSGDGENTMQTQQSLSSQKLEVVDDDGDDDDDSDRTICMEESNPLDTRRAASQLSLALLGTQPDSEEEIDDEESKRNALEGREQLSQGKENHASAADALVSTSTRRSKLMDQNCEIASKGGSDSDDDTDVGEIGPLNDPLEEGSSHEHCQSTSKLGKAPYDEEVYKEECNEETNKNTSTLLSDPIEDADDETDTEGETKVHLTNNVTSNLYHHRRGNNEKLSVSEKEGETSLNHLSSPNVAISSKAKGTSCTDFDAVQLSPSLCAETEDPPVSNRKFIAQESATLSSSLKESTQETTSEYSVSLLSPAMGMVEVADAERPTKCAEAIDTRNGKNKQESLRPEKGKPFPPTLVIENGHEKRPTENENNQCMESSYSEDGRSTNFGKIQVATNLENDERGEKSRTNASICRSERNESATIEEQQLDPQLATHSASSTSSGCAQVVSNIGDSNRSSQETTSAQKVSQQYGHLKEEFGVHESKHSPPPRALPEHTSPASDSPSNFSGLTNQRKSKRRRSIEIAEVAAAKGPKLPRQNTTLNSRCKCESSNEEIFLETFCIGNAASPTVNGTTDPQTQISRLTGSRKRARKTRNSETSKSKPMNEESSSSKIHEGARSAHKRRRSSRETISFVHDEAPARVLTTGIELTASQKSMIKRVGGILLQKIEDAHSATHVLTAQPMRRTPKLMIGLCKTSNIVDLEWLIQSSKQHKALPCMDFQLLHDSHAEAQYKFEMRESLRRAGRMRSTGDSLLGGFLVYCCPGVTGNKKKGNMTPPAKEFRLIVEAAGALWAQSLAKVGDFSKLIIVVSKLEDEAARQLSTKKVDEALRKGAITKSTEDIFHSIMQQQFIP